MAFSFLQIIRIERWWLYKASPLLGIAYIFIFINRISFPDAVFLLFWFLVAMAGIAGLGYFINDFFDREKDILSGKPNLVATMPSWKIGLILILLLCLSTVPWWYLPHSAIVIVFIALQFALFLLYSHPVFRFKEKPLLGVLSDVFYGHVVPFLITVMVFGFTFTNSSGEYVMREEYFRFFRIFLISATAWQVAKGLRNMLLHQIDDRKNDRKAGILTLVLKNGPMKTIHCINRIILPLELVLFSAVLIVLSLNVPFFYLWFLFFLAWSFVYFTIYRIGSIPTRQFRVKFLFFFNDFYEMWMPVIAAAYMVVIDARFLALLFAHLILFNRIPRKFVIDLKVIVSNIKFIFKRKITSTDEK